jgi:hypothetical protein
MQSYSCLSSTYSEFSAQFIMDILIDQFELEETGRFRAVPNANDVVAILYHHWVLNDDYFPEERQRLQLAIMDIFCASTTARAGTVFESSCYFGQNEAVEYRDIEIYAVRDDNYPGGVKLGMLIQLRLLKGRRNRGNPLVFQPNESTLELTWLLDLRSNSLSAATHQASV